MRRYRPKQHRAAYNFSRGTKPSGASSRSCLPPFKTGEYRAAFSVLIPATFLSAVSCAILPRFRAVPCNRGNSDLSSRGTLRASRAYRSFRFQTQRPTRKNKCANCTLDCQEILERQPGCLASVQHRRDRMRMAISLACCGVCSRKIHSFPPVWVST
jgi:hypothetical protein